MAGTHPRMLTSCTPQAHGPLNRQLSVLARTLERLKSRRTVSGRRSNDLAWMRPPARAIACNLNMEDPAFGG
jgi:hypothetical protein